MADGKPGRKNTLAKNAEKVHPSLTPEEGYALDTIRRRRKDRGHSRCDVSQVIATHRGGRDYQGAVA